MADLVIRHAEYSADGGLTWSGAEVLPDGVHLGLEAETYFDQRALGSTDLMALFKHREGWWWKSRNNPRYKRPSSPFQTYGSATHAIILEGVAAYDARYVAAPDYSQIEGLFDTVEEIKARFREAGFTITGPRAPRGIGFWTKVDWIKAMVDNDLDWPCKSLIEYRFRKGIGKRELISADDDWSIRYMREVMLDPTRPDNEDIRGVFAEGGEFPTLAEVSILHTLPDGVRRRWRIDRMFPAFDLDLKTLGNWSGRPLEFETGQVITQNGYDIQRADYAYGRRIAYEYIKAGHLFGGTPEQRKWLRTWPEAFPQWDWKWLFYQKPDSRAGRAPVVFPIHDDHDSPRLLTGAQKVQVAMANYRRFVALWGLDRPWARVAPMHFTDENRYHGAPLVQFPHWIDSVELPPDADAWGSEDAAQVGGEA